MKIVNGGDGNGWVYINEDKLDVSDGITFKLNNLLENKKREYVISHKNQKKQYYKSKYLSPKEHDEDTRTWDNYNTKKFKK